MFLSRDEVRDLDRTAIEKIGIPGVVLMENAGRGAAELLMALGVHAAVSICCGKGNNGGDGYVIARHLANAGYSVRVFVFAPEDAIQGDAAINLHVVKQLGIATEHLDPAGIDPDNFAQTLSRGDWVVDALFGTGLTGPIRPPMDRVVAAINASGAHVFAVDIPSGLNCDDGVPMGPTVRAEYTATFVAEKRGFANPESRQWTGQVHVVDIGVPLTLAERYKGP